MEQSEWTRASTHYSSDPKMGRWLCDRFAGPVSSSTHDKTITLLIRYRNSRETMPFEEWTSRNSGIAPSHWGVILEIKTNGVIRKDLGVNRHFTKLSPGENDWHSENDDHPERCWVKEGIAETLCRPLEVVSKEDSVNPNKSSRSPAKKLCFVSVNLLVPTWRKRALYSLGEFFRRCHGGPGDFEDKQRI